MIGPPPVIEKARTRTPRESCPRVDRRTAIVRGRRVLATRVTAEPVGRLPQLQQQHYGNDPATLAAHCADFCVRIGTFTRSNGDPDVS